MLSISNLVVSVNDKKILKGINLTVNPGEVHAIMGPNGSGKSTLSHVLAGKPGYDIQQGNVNYLNHNLLELPIEARAAAGLFLSLQYPVEIPGVSNIAFLKAAINAQRKLQGLQQLDAIDILTLVKGKVAELGMDESMLYRAVNEGFSGGEKKRNEMLQMTVLSPKLAVLDETDSGLDIDALKVIANAINTQRNADRAILLVTHYQRLLNYVQPDYVHVLMNGEIVKSGGFELAETLEAKGYGWLASDTSVDANIPA